jgi:S1-C subfamily serine protease
VTNAHVVWPYTTVRVVAVGGHEYDEVPVLGWDLVADLAVLGPLEWLEAAPLALTDGEALVVGSDVYLIGYPGEVSHIPEPTLTRGLISRLREWDAVGITFFQSDATIAGGQSAGRWSPTWVRSSAFRASPLASGALPWSPRQSISSPASQL